MVRMATVSAVKKRNCLTLKKKVEVIKYAAKYPGVNLRALADNFEGGKTQIATKQTTIHDFFTSK